MACLFFRVTGNLASPDSPWIRRAFTVRRFAQGFRLVISLHHHSVVQNGVGDLLRHDIAGVPTVDGSLCGPVTRWAHRGDAEPDGTVGQRR